MAHLLYGTDYYGHKTVYEDDIRKHAMSTPDHIWESLAQMYYSLSDEFIEEFKDKLWPDQSKVPTQLQSRHRR